MKNLTLIIMAAGRGKRLLPLTSTVPKPLTKILGKTILEYNLDNFIGRIGEVVLIVGQLKEKIIDFFGNNYKGIKINYIVQAKPIGNAHALHLAREVVESDNILVLNGDDLYDKEVVLKMLKIEGDAIIGKKEENWKNYGVIKIKDKKYLERIVEKPSRYVGNLINIGFYKINTDIFKYFAKIKKSKRGEYEITDMIGSYANDHKVQVIKCESGWRSLSYPWNILDLSEALLKSMKAKVSGKIEKGVVIKGKLHLGKNSIIKSGVYLEGDFYIGDNCEIGPNCYLKGFATIDDGSVIGNAVEITRSVIGGGTKIKHFSYIGDSIIGSCVNIGAGTILSNLRHDEKNICVEIDGKLVDTGRRKFGAIIGDGVKTGVHTVLYPGTKLAANSMTLPNQVVIYLQE